MTQRFQRTSESIVRTVARQLFSKDLVAGMAATSATIERDSRS